MLDFSKVKQQQQNPFEHQRSDKRNQRIRENTHKIIGSRIYEDLQLKKHMHIKPSFKMDKIPEQTFFQKGFKNDIQA